MSIHQFLQSVSPCNSEQEPNFNDVLRTIPYNATVFFQPVVSYDLTPLQILQDCISAGAPFSDDHQVFIMPVAHMWFSDTLKRDLLAFSHHGHIPDLGVGVPAEAEFLEYIPLFSRHLARSQDPSDIRLFYVSLLLNDSTVHLFLCLDEPENVWKCLVDRCNCVPTVVIDSHKGLTRQLCYTELYRGFMDCTDPAFLPRFYLAGEYAGAVPEDFRPVFTTLSNKLEATLYLTPWGAKDPETLRIAESIARQTAENEQTRRKLWDEIDHFMADPTGAPPIEAIRSCLQYCREDMAKDGGATDLTVLGQQNFYTQGTQVDIDKRPPSIRLTNRSKFFLLLSLLFVLEDDRVRSPYRAELYKLLRYHVMQREKYIAKDPDYPYLFVSNDLHFFAMSIYDYVKFLSSYEEFAFLFGADASLNLLEEEMLKCAYRKNDIEFANWIVENCFFGRMQTALFEIVYKNDKEKAANLASRFSPVCIAQILTDTCFKAFKYGQSDPSPEIRFIFKHITKDSALKVDQYIRAYRKRVPIYMTIYQELLDEYFHS